MSEGKVQYWCSDGQDGGSMELVTPEEATRRDDLLARAYGGDKLAASQVDWEVLDVCPGAYDSHPEGPNFQG
jgi:hypothetical protein